MKSTLASAFAATLATPLVATLAALTPADATAVHEPSAISAHYDLVVIGGTPGGIACAVRAAREGLDVLLVNHTQHIGGFITSGAGGWETPCDYLRSPLYAEMILGAAEHYRLTYGENSPQHRASLPNPNSRAHIERAKVEPRVAEMLFEQMVAREKKLTVLKGFYVSGAERDGARLIAVTIKQLQHSSPPPPLPANHAPAASPPAPLPTAPTKAILPPRRAHPARSDANRAPSTMNPTLVSFTPPNARTHRSTNDSLMTRFPAVSIYAASRTPPVLCVNPTALARATIPSWLTTTGSF